MEKKMKTENAAALMADLDHQEQTQQEELVHALHELQQDVEDALRQIHHGDTPLGIRAAVTGIRIDKATTRLQFIATQRAALKASL